VGGGGGLAGAIEVVRGWDRSFGRGVGAADIAARVHRGLDRQDLLVRAWNRWAENLSGLRREAVRAAPTDGRRTDETVLGAVDRRGKAVRVRVATSPMVQDGDVRGAILLMEDEGD
jgi:hypothetical protein